MRPYFKVKRVREGATLPSKRDEDAGFDLYGISEPFLLRPQEVKLVPTGLSVEFPKDWVFYIVERSSTGSRGIAKRCGVIDSGYRGEVFVALGNSSNKPILFFDTEEKKENLLSSLQMTEQDITPYPLTKAIAQGMLLYCPHVDVEEVEELSESQRMDNALGSTGK